MRVWVSEYPNELKVHKQENFLLNSFAETETLWSQGPVTRDFWKIVFNSAEIFDFYTFPRMLSRRWNPFRVCSASDEIRSAYAQCAMKFVSRMLSMDLHVKTVHILSLAEHARKFVPRMLSVRWNRFLVCSVCDKIVSAYAQHVHAIIFENFSKIPNKMQILTIKNQNFEKPLRNPSNRTKVNFLTKIVFTYLFKKIWFRECSVTPKCPNFEFYSDKNRWKRSEIFVENLPRA